MNIWPRTRGFAGFTLIELMIVMAIIALLLTLVAPRYFGHVDKAKEAVLRQNLTSVRDTLDKFYSDTGKYPASLADLVSGKYLRNLPVDPITERTDTWVVVAPSDPEMGGVADIHSGATVQALDGSLYSEW